MTSLLSWREACAADRSELPNFSCTEDATKRRIGRGDRHELVHPRLWEWKVQCKIRSLKPPYRGEVAVLVGCDAEGIAAVSVIDEVEGPALVELSHMAIARRLRGRGGGYADEMLSQSFDFITTRALEAGVPEVEVFGYVHALNHPSQDVCRRFGLRHITDVSADLQHWGRDLPISTD